MAFGVYIHIPYCLQRCSYCDFATYEKSQILAPDLYVEKVINEIRLKAPSIRKPEALATIYFGGGTPSLLEPTQLVKIIRALDEAGFSKNKNTEITLEINPATLSPQKVEDLLKNGFNRFSVGAQTFKEPLLKVSNRIHSAQDTRETLKLLKDYKINFSLDILFALPTQTLDDLRYDLDEALKFDPPHVSPYCLTVPEGHPMSKGRAPDEEQAKMFDLIAERLTNQGLRRYEISNFAKPGFESRHNLLYWTDEEYWGIGLSSHSYLHAGEFGTRFWNTRRIEDYVQHVDSLAPVPGKDEKLAWSLASHDPEMTEALKQHQAMTDFCHTSLRMEDGLSLKKFEKKFGKSLAAAAPEVIDKNLKSGLLHKPNHDHLALTSAGILLSNQVFLDFTFTSET